MPKKVSRRSFLKKSFTTVLSSAGLATGGYLYARKVEPKLLDIQQHSIKSTQIPKEFNGFKIVQFSDTHIGFQYNLQQLYSLVGKINELKPDVIFFTGDLMDEPNKYGHTEEIVTILKKLKAPYGKFAIYGNHDHGGYGSDIYKNIMELSDFKLLVNESSKISVLNQKSIYVLGIDDAMLGRPDIKLAMDGIPDKGYKILLSHAPDLADGASSFGINLQLSGHSHGGQIKIPFIGALVTPPYAEKYYEGFYKIGDTDPLTLYVNRGLGTTRLPFRFLSRPELTVFTLSAKD